MGVSSQALGRKVWSWREGGAPKFHHPTSTQWPGPPSSQGPTSAPSPLSYSLGLPSSSAFSQSGAPFSPYPQSYTEGRGLYHNVYTSHLAKEEYDTIITTLGTKWVFRYSFQGGTSGKESACQCRKLPRCRLEP